MVDKHIFKHPLPFGKRFFKTGLCLFVIFRKALRFKAEIFRRLLRKRIDRMSEIKAGKQFCGNSESGKIRRLFFCRRRRAVCRQKRFRRVRSFFKGDVKLRRKSCGKRQPCGERHVSFLHDGNKPFPYRNIKFCSYIVVLRRCENIAEVKRDVYKRNRLFFGKKQLADRLARRGNGAFVCVTRVRTSGIKPANVRQGVLSAMALKCTIAVGVVHGTFAVISFGKHGVTLARRMVENIDGAVQPFAQIARTVHPDKSAIFLHPEGYFPTVTAGLSA